MTKKDTKPLGEQAHRAGKLFKDNPHQVGSYPWSRWNLGWISAAHAAARHEEPRSDIPDQARPPGG